MPVHQQRRPPRIGPRNPRDDTAAPGMRLIDRRFDPDLVQLSGDILCRHALPRPGMVAVVGRVDRDELLAQPHDLALGRNYPTVSLTHHDANRILSTTRFPSTLPWSPTTQKRCPPHLGPLLWLTQPAHPAQGHYVRV